MITVKSTTKVDKSPKSEDNKKGAVIKNEKTYVGKAQISKKYLGKTNRISKRFLGKPKFTNKVTRKQRDNARISHSCIQPTPVVVEKQVVMDTVTVLRKLNEHFAENSTKKPLFGDIAETPIQLQLTMKKIPSKSSKQMIKVNLPHSLMVDTTEVCLITGDLNKKDRKADIEPTIAHYKELLKKNSVENIAEVVPLRQLRTEYRTIETKRQLCGAYDIFLSDKKIHAVLPAVLGKEFYKKRKFPIQINLSAPKLKQQIDKAVSQTVFHLTCRGNSCTTEVARLGMNDDEIYDNVLMCIETLKTKLTCKSANILGLYLKTAKSEAIPLFISYDNPNHVVFESEVNEEHPLPENLSTMKNTAVKVYKDGTVQVVKTNDDPNEGSDDREMESKSDIPPKKLAKPIQKVKKRNAESLFIGNFFKLNCGTSERHFKKQFAGRKMTRPFSKKQTSEKIEASTTTKNEETTGEVNTAPSIKQETAKGSGEIAPINENKPEAKKTTTNKSIDVSVNEGELIENDNIQPPTKRIKIARKSVKQEELKNELANELIATKTKSAKKDGENSKIKTSKKKLTKEGIAKKKTK